MRFQAVFSLALFGASIPAQASATYPEDALALSSTLGVPVSALTQISTANITSDLDVGMWTNALRTSDPDYVNWTDDIKVEFLEDMKSIITTFLDEISDATSNTALTKRVTGSNSAAARAQVQAAIAAAKASRDSSNRRKLLQCNSGTQKSCTICATICSTAWAGASAVCGGVALGAEAASGGVLTAAVALTLGGCLTVATSAYAACIVKCVG